jgi:chromosome segregation ATPase
MKVREYFKSVKEQLEEFIDDLQRQLQQARAEIEQKSEQIEGLSTEGQAHVAEVKRLRDEVSKLETITKAIEGEGSKLLATFSHSHELAHFILSAPSEDHTKVETFEDWAKERFKKLSLQGKTGAVCQRSGLYACVVHPSNKIPLANGNRFPPCSLDGGHATTWLQTNVGDSK